jgi:hypothetical protein
VWKFRQDSIGSGFVPESLEVDNGYLSKVRGVRFHQQLRNYKFFQDCCDSCIYLTVKVNKIKNIILKLTELCPSALSSLLLICRKYCGSFSMSVPSRFPESFDLLLNFFLYVKFWHRIRYDSCIVSGSNRMWNSRRVSAILNHDFSFFQFFQENVGLVRYCFMASHSVDCS